MTNARRPRQSCFRFCNMWSSDADFIPIVQNVWRQQVHGSLMFQIAVKFHRLRKALTPLRRKFTAVVDKVEELRQQLEEIQNKLDNDHSNVHLVTREREVKADFVFWNQAAHSYMRQKTKDDWLVLGDANTKYFHDAMRQRHYKQRIYSVATDSGLVLTDYDQVVEHFRAYYENLLGGVSSQHTRLQQEVIDEGPVLTLAQQLSLLSPVSETEIKDAFWSIPIDKSPGPDGLNSGFFREAWPVVCDDMVKAIQGFFRTGSLLDSLNSTHLILLAKTDNPNTAADYRPIACCGVFYKVIAKVLSAKLQRVLP